MAHWLDKDRQVIVFDCLSGLNNVRLWNTITEIINQSFKIVKWITSISESWIEMLYLLIGIIIFGIVVYIVTYVRSIRKARREIDGLFKKRIN